MKLDPKRAKLIKQLEKAKKCAEKTSAEITESAAQLLGVDPLQMGYLSEIGSFSKRVENELTVMQNRVRKP